MLTSSGDVRLYPPSKARSTSKATAPIADEAARIGVAAHGQSSPNIVRSINTLDVLYKAGAATAGTFVVIGGATLATTSVVMTVVRAAVNHRKKSLSIACTPCSGQKLVTCSVCKGRNLIDWSPFEDPVGRTPTLCPMCGGFGQQTCMNCNGEGTVVPPQLPPWAADAQKAPPLCA